MKEHFEKLQRTTDDIIIILTDEEELFRKKFISEKLDNEWKCTICAKITTDKPYPHPALRVSICFDCLNSYQSAVFLVNKDGTDKNCRWCTKPSKKYSCSLCTVIFCKDCLERNFGPEFVRSRITNNSDWKCFICYSNPIWRLRVACSKAMEGSKSLNEIEVIEVIELNGQESQEPRMPFSQLAFTTGETQNEQFSPEMVETISFKINDSNDNLQTPLETNIIYKQNISIADRNFLRVVLKAYENYFHNFIELFIKRVNQLFQTFNGDIDNYLKAIKLINKVSEFCDSVVKDINFIKDKNQARFDVWLERVKLTHKNNGHDGTKPNSTPAESKNNSMCKLEESSISSKSSKKVRRKLSLNLKSTKDLNEHIISSDSEDTVSFLEKISLTLPEDEISPSKKSNNSDTQNSCIKKAEELNSTSKNETESPKCALQEIIEEMVEELLPPVIKHVARKKTGSVPKSSLFNPVKRNIAVKRTSPRSPVINSKIKEDTPEKVTSPNKPKINLQTETSFLNSSPVKSELTSKAGDVLSLSHHTVLRNSTDINQTLTGEEDLITRIREDFGEDIKNELPENDVTVRIENYLCESTGEMCQIYQSGPISEAASTSIAENFAFSELSLSDEDISEKTDEYCEKNIQNNLKVNNYLKQIEDQMLSSQNISEIDDKSDIDLLPETQLLEKEKTTQLSENLNVEEDISNEIDNNINDITESSINSDSDSELEREEALKALQMESDISDLESTSSSTDSEDSFYQNCVEPNTSNTTGYVKQLDIFAEIAKLRENHLGNINEQKESEIEEVEISSEEENTELSYDPNLDPKFKLQPVTLLDRNFKLSLKPIVLLEKLDLKCLDTSFEDKIDESLSVSCEEIEDSEDEIRRITDLTPLKKRKNNSSSDSDSKYSNSRKKYLRKKHKTSSVISSSDSDSDATNISKKSDSSLNNLNFLTEIDPDFVPPIGDDILNDSITEESTSDEDFVEVKKHKKKKEDNNIESLITDEEDTENSKEIDKKSKWRKNKLLTSSLLLSDSDTDITNDSTANEILKKEEENYLKKVDTKKKKRKNSVESINSSDTEDDAIILSDDDTESDDDIQFVGLKRNRNSDDENDGNTTNKKGRRNIREVLKDSELQEETQKADKEEAERKERITLKQKTLESLLSETQLSQEELGYVLDVDEIKKEPLITVHHTLVPRLKEHQKKGIKFLWDACYESVSELQRSKGAGCILAHCMGLGKTMQVVVLAHTLLTHEITAVKHILIVCPLSTVFNWRNEFQQTLKVCPKRIGIFDIRPGRQKNFKEKIFEVKRWKNIGGALMLGYESFLSLVNEEKLNKTQEEYKKIILESLVNPGPDLIVCDEGHMLKNGKTLRFTSLSKIKTRRRIILTGTPLQNNLIEYYHMVNFVKPHLLGTLEEYKNRFVNPILNGQYEDSNESDIHLMKKRSHILHKKLENSVQRYEESELQPYLPKKHDYVLYVQLTPLQILLYEHYLQLPDAKPSKLFKNYHSLQNIWTHPALLKIKLDKRRNPPQKKQKRYDEDFVQALDPDSEVTETDWFEDLLPEDVLTNISYGMKIEILFSVIKECEDLNDKLLVFSSSMDELDLIEYFLKQNGKSKGLDYCRMDGTVAPEKRIKYCNDFNDENNPRTRLFLVSHKVGGLGLNLTAANRVILMDVSWNPAYDIQSVFRVYRFGQTKTCYVYRFVSMGTMEEVVYGRAVTKLAISCRVVDEHQIKRHFNSDDLQRMYRLDKDYGDPPILMLPADRLLAKIWDKHKPLLFKFCDHQMLLQNQTHEELNEEEMKLALEEFAHELEREKLAKETASLRQQNAIYWPQQYAQNNNYVPPPNTNAQNIKYTYPIVPNTSFQKNMLNLKPQMPNFPPTHRFKPPNKQSPKQNLESAFRKYLHSIGYLRQNITTDEPMPSTSSGPGPSTSRNSPTPRTYNYVMPSTSATFANASNFAKSVNSNFSKIRQRASEISENNLQPLNLTTNIASAQESNEVSINATQKIIFPFGAPNSKSIRNLSNNINENQISNLNVSSGIVDIASNGQKENISQVQRNINSSNKNLAFVTDNSNQNERQTTPLQDRVLVRKEFD